MHRATCTSRTSDEDSECSTYARRGDRGASSKRGFRAFHQLHSLLEHLRVRADNKANGCATTRALPAVTRMLPSKAAEELLEFKANEPCNNLHAASWVSCFIASRVSRSAFRTLRISSLSILVLGETRYISGQSRMASRSSRGLRSISCRMIRSCLRVSSCLLDSSILVRVPCQWVVCFPSGSVGGMYLALWIGLSATSLVLLVAGCERTGWYVTGLASAVGAIALSPHLP